MNRQLKRANEKSDKKRGREQERRKAQRRQSRVRVSKAAPKSSAKDSAKDDSGTPERSTRPAPGMRRPWITVAYLLFSVMVIIAGAWIPPQTDPFSLVVHTLIYLTLGYFLSIWLYRRGVAQALTITVAGGMLLAFGVEGLKLVLPQLELGPTAAEATGSNLLFTYLALPGLVLGAVLGRFVRRSES